MWDTFAAKALTRRVIARLVGDGEVYLTAGGLAIAVEGGEGPENWRQVGFLTGEKTGTVRLIRHLFGLKGKRRVERCFVYVPQGSRLIAGLRAAGLKRDFSLILFERKAAKG
jgi:hypothetical protein